MRFFLICLYVQRASKVHTCVLKLSRSYDPSIWEWCHFWSSWMFCCKYFALSTPLQYLFHQLSASLNPESDLTSASVWPTFSCPTFLWHSSTSRSTIQCLVGRSIGCFCSNVSCAFLNLPPHLTKPSWC